MPALPRRFRVVRIDREREMGRVDAQLRAWGGDLAVLPDGTPEDVLTRATADAELLLTCYARITRQVLAGAPKLRAVVKYGVGIDTIDLEAARSLRIPVVNVPAYAEETVAEGAFMLLMALFKQVKPIQRAMQADGWVWPESRWLGHDLAGKTVGLVGLGRIGRRMARLAEAFRMQVLASNPGLSQADAPPGVQLFDDLDAMIQRCDVVSIHCVLNATTRHLIGATQIGLMKPGAFLVNVSRGEIVDETALVRALAQRRIAGAALDVYGREPLTSAGHPMSALYAMDNVLLWPHLTFYTHEAMRRLEDETLARSREALEGGPVTVVSRDSRLRSQIHGVRFADAP